MANHQPQQQTTHHHRSRPHAPIHNHQQQQQQHPQQPHQLESQPQQAAPPTPPQVSQPLHNQAAQHMAHNPQHIHHPTFPHQQVSYVTSHMYTAPPYHSPYQAVYPSPPYNMDSTYLPHHYQPQPINPMQISSPNVPPQTKSSHNLNPHVNERQPNPLTTSQANAVPSQAKNKAPAVLKDPNSLLVIDWKSLAMNPSQLPRNQNNLQNNVVSAETKTNTVTNASGASNHNKIASELLAKVAAIEDTKKSDADNESAKSTPFSVNDQSGVTTSTTIETNSKPELTKAASLNIAPVDKTFSNDNVSIQGDAKLEVAQSKATTVADKKEDNIQQHTNPTDEKILVNDTKDEKPAETNDMSLKENQEPTSKTDAPESNKQIEENADVDANKVITEGSAKQDQIADQIEETILDGKDNQEISTILKYDNNEQYNPVTNRDGKKKYSKRFLFEVCEKVCKLKVLEAVEKTSREASKLGGALSEKIDYFAPPFSSNRYNPMNRQNDARRQNQNAFGGRNSAGPDKPRRIIVAATPTPEVELKTAEKPWRPAKEVEVSVPPEQLEIDIMKKKFRGILNKLTPQNFDSLAKLVPDLNINTESKLEQVIDIVFAKALAEPGFCELYGRMCSLLKKITAGTAIFGNTLLKRCQLQFQSDVYAGINVQERQEAIDKEEDPEIKKHLEEELYEDMWKCRKRSLGLIKFIGELYKIEMLNNMIMFECINRLLVDKSEESLECLCDLLVTVGERLDKSCQKEAAEKDKKTAKSSVKAKTHAGQIAYATAAASTPIPQKNAEPQSSLDSVFEQLHKIRKGKDMSSRIKFKLLDTCDLREKYKWHSRKANDNNLQTIDDIHKEAHEKKLELEKRIAKRQDGRRGFGHSGSSNQISSMVNDGPRNLHQSASSHVLREQVVNENIKANQNDLEKEHATNKEKIKNLISSGGLADGSSTNGGGGLRPRSMLYKAQPPASVSSLVCLTKDTGLRKSTTGGL